MASNVNVIKRTSARFVSVRIGSLACSSTTAPSTPAAPAIGTAAATIASRSGPLPYHAVVAAPEQRVAQRLVGDAARGPLRRIRRILALEQPAQKAAEQTRAVVAGRARRDAPRRGEHPAVSVEHAKPPARATELAEQVLQLGSLTDESPRGTGRLVPSRRELDGVIGAAAVDVDDADAERVADQVQRHAHFERVAARGLGPRADDAPVVHLARLEAVGLRLLRAERAGRRRVQQPPARGAGLGREHDRDRRTASGRVGC